MPHSEAGAGMAAARARTKIEKQAGCEVRFGLLSFGFGTFFLANKFNVSEREENDEGDNDHENGDNDDDDDEEEEEDDDDNGKAEQTE